MRRIVLLALLAAAVVAAGAPADAAGQTAYAFGRTGGNIRPYTVTISTAGVVRTSGPVSVGLRRLDARQLATLHRLAVTVRFATLPATTLCAGTLPDVGATFVRVGSRRVLVHGDCVPRYARLWGALTRAVRLSS